MYPLSISRAITREKKEEKKTTFIPTRSLGTGLIKKLEKLQFQQRQKSIG